MFLIEVLSHVAFFIMFLTVFYVTFISYTQQKSMINDLNSLFTDSTNTLIITLPPSVLGFLQGVLTGLQSVMDPILGQVSSSIADKNKQVVTPIFIYSFSIAGALLLISVGLSMYYGYSVFQLFYTNLISITFIAITEIIITTLYGQFKLLDSQYLNALIAIKAAGGTIDCNEVGKTLNQMFPGMGLDKLI